MARSAAHRLPEVTAAGAVVTRNSDDVLLVHRPKYDDWSFPEGKRGSGEHLTATAVREVAEETSLDIRLGPSLSTRRYLVTKNGERRMKQVHYWVGWVVGDDDVSTYPVNDEIDKVGWVPLEKAREQLDYEYDAMTLAEFERHREKSYPLVVLRHGRALARKSWTKNDRDRPLTETGESQAQGVVPVLGAYGVTRVLTSSSRRCWTTVAPYAEAAGIALKYTDDLSEEDPTPRARGRTGAGAADPRRGDHTLQPPPGAAVGL